MEGEKRNLKVMLAVHVYGMVEGETLQATLGELTTPAPGINWEIVLPGADALLSRLRSMLVTEAILGGYDVLIWLDHDMVWAPGMLAELARKCAEVQGVVGGLFPFRSEVMRGKGFPWRPLARGPVEIAIGQDRLVEAEAVSGGFVAFWVPALKAMVERLSAPGTSPELKVTKCRTNPPGHFFWDVCRPVAIPYEDGSTASDGCCSYVSDDWVLMKRLRECGTHVFAWYKPHLTHIGKKGFTPADALAGAPAPQAVRP